MTIDSPIFVVSASGITAPTYDEILEYFKDKAKSIFGSDINLDADTQDGQLLAIFSAAINDLNAQAISVFNAYNPNTASGGTPPKHQLSQFAGADAGDKKGTSRKAVPFHFI